MNAAKLITSAGKSVEFKQANGLFDCLMKHKVSETTATFDWKGPKITEEAWNQILSFFQWSFKQNRSESQVRLFVHPEHGWLAWAFPQQGMGMTTREVENDDSKKQRAEIVPPGYLAFGTVHHHCDMSAFQSGTDERDEEGVDGLHITVGDIGKEKFSMDTRLYIKGNKFTPNMGAFFNIGAEHEPHLEWMATVGYKTDEARDHIARLMMCLPVSEDTLFPELWKSNYIIPPPPPPYQPNHHTGNFQHTMVGGPGKTNGVASAAEAGSMNSSTDMFSAGEVLDELGLWVKNSKYSEAELYRAINNMGDDLDDELKEEIYSRLYFENITAEDLRDEMRRRERVAKNEMEVHNQSQSLIAWDGYSG